MMWAAPWVAAFGLVLTSPVAARAQEALTIVSASYENPTTIYDHGILGDRIEYLDLALTLSDGRRQIVSLAGLAHVFEDFAPRLWDITGDGAPEAVVIETDIARGAQLAVYGISGGAVAKIAETPHIGQTHRWLAPIGAADLDGDGAIEVAYIDRPHLARELRVWRYDNGAFTQIAAGAGLTNHRIGQTRISGGLRDCGNGAPELVTADADWSRIIATRLEDGTLKGRVVGPFTGPEDFDAALGC